MRSIGIAVAHTDPRVVDELIHDVEASDDLYLALDPGSAAVVVAGEAGLRAYADRPPRAGTGVVALSVDGDLPLVAKAALACGAHDVVRWPEDRTSLRSTLRASAARASVDAVGAAGLIVTIVGARGGAGATTVAALLAAALGAVIADLDRVGAGQAVFAPVDTEPTLEEVLAAAGDLDPAALESAFAPHAAGKALCGRPRSVAATAEQTASLLTLLRATTPIAICDAGRAGDAAGEVLLQRSDAVICVLAGDVSSMRGALAVKAQAGRPVRMLLNAAERARLRPRDVARVLGVAPACTVPFDPGVRRAGEAGRVPSRGRARRVIDRFAHGLLEELPRGS